MTSQYRYAYIHGFASGPASYKGRHLAGRFREHGLEFELPDLNRPSFGQLTYTAALTVLDEMDSGDERPWRLIGSSMGGYLSVRWAQLNPGRVDRLVLLCPGFRLPERWPHLVGPERMKSWERDGELNLPGPTETLEPVHWGFIEDARRHPAAPDVECETLIIHGKRDPTVPIESSRRYAKDRDLVRFIEVDDDHGLVKSLNFITETVEEFFQISQ